MAGTALTVTGAVCGFCQTINYSVIETNLYSIVNAL